METALNQVRDKVGLVRNLPRTSLKPVVDNLQVNERIARVLITSDDSLSALRPYAKKFEKSLLNKPSTTCGVTRLAKTSFEYRVNPDSNCLSETLVFRYWRSNPCSESGYLSRRCWLSLAGETATWHVKKRSTSDFSRLPIVTGDSGMLVHLIDMASLKMGLEDKPKLVYSGGKSAIVSLFIEQSIKAL